MSLTVTADSAGRVTAQYSPESDAVPPGREELDAAVNAAGYGEYFRHEKNIDVMLSKAATASASISALVAERRDAQSRVEVSPDKMQALLTIEPAYGGRPLVRDEVLVLLNRQGIRFGIDYGAIEQALASQCAEKRLIAQGEHAIDGEDAHFKLLIPEIRERKPKVDEKGLADFRDLGGVMTVEAGQALMRRYPPLPGTNGRNVYGEVVLAKPGKDMNFAGALGGAAVTPEDPNVLASAIAGQPVAQRDGVKVEPVITLDSVDLKSGNIDFKGTVHVTGDITSGMRVKAEGDVVVGGVIEAAEVEAGGDVVVRGGIVGHPAGRSKDGRFSGEMARVTARYSVQAKYMENGLVSAGNDVMVEEAIIQSDVSAMGRVMVGRQGSKKSCLMGSNVSALTLVKVPVLGSQGSGETRVSVGVSPVLARKLSDLRSAVEKRKAELAEVDKLLAYLAAHPEKGEDLLSKARRTREAIESDIAQKTEEDELLSAEVKLAEKARVEVTQRIDGSVRVCIGVVCTFIPEHREAGVFYLTSEGEMRYGDWTLS